MIEKNRDEFPDINHTDRIFDHDGTLIKVRIRRQDVHRDNLITSPQAIALLITGSSCDNQGKAIKRADGNYYICSKSHTITLETMSDINLTNKVTEMIEECCKMTVQQKHKIEELDALVNYWGSLAQNFTGD